MSTMNRLMTQLPQITRYSTRSRAEKDAAKADGGATNSKVRRLGALPHNRECADCESRITGWASLPHGCFICINCAQAHRSLGRDLAQVKSYSTGTYCWFEDEFAAMEAMGNSNVTALYAPTANGAPPKPGAQAAPAERERYIRDKYVRLKWHDPGFERARSHRHRLKPEPRQRPAPRLLHPPRRPQRHRHLAAEPAEPSLLDSAVPSTEARPCLTPARARACPAAGRHCRAKSGAAAAGQSDFFAAWGV